MTYLIDVNLPVRFSHIKTINCLFVKDLTDEMPDSEIWEMATANEYTILTRDKDFYYRAVQSTLLPKIVLFRLGIAGVKNCLSILKTIFLSSKSTLCFIKF